MEISFRSLPQDDKDLIKELYKKADSPGSDVSRLDVQKQLAAKYGITPRSIRNWARKLQVGVMTKNITDPRKILIYDLETSLVEANVFWTGKQYVPHGSLRNEPKIISIAWKWFSEDKVYADTWNIETQDEVDMLKNFLEYFNKADLVVGINNSRFDERFLFARCLKHKLDVNTFVKSLDLQKQAKRFLRIPSYSMKYMAEFLELSEKKGSHSGIDMWKDVQYGDLKTRKRALKEMVDYNVQDILVTERIYLRMLPILDFTSHLGVLSYGSEKYSCPSCGESENIKLYKTLVTKAGTIQHVMQCEEDKVKYKISNREYLKWLNN